MFLILNPTVQQFWYLLISNWAEAKVHCSVWKELPNSQFGMKPPWITYSFAVKLLKLSRQPETCRNNPFLFIFCVLCKHYKWKLSLTLNPTSRLKKKEVQRWSGDGWAVRTVTAVLKTPSWRKQEEWSLRGQVERHVLFPFSINKHVWVMFSARAHRFCVLVSVISRDCSFPLFGWSWLSKVPLIQTKGFGASCSKTATFLHPAKGASGPWHYASLNACGKGSS